MRNQSKLLSISIGLVFIMFGGLKFFSNLSPAEDIAIDTIQTLTMNQLTPGVSITLLAVLEVGIGLLLIFQKGMKLAVVLAIFHLIMTFTPFFIFPDRVFSTESHSFSLLGQYILKNIVLLSALVALYPTNKNEFNRAYS